MRAPSSDRADPRPVSTSARAPALGALLREHWLVRLGARAVFLGVTPFLVYEGYLLTFGGAGAHEVRLGVLAFLGLNLGVLLLAAGVVTVLASRARRGTRGSEPARTDFPS